MTAIFLNSEVVKIDEKGQWKIEKAIKPGPALNYAKDINPRKTKQDYANIEAKATTIDYSDPKNVAVKKPWSGKAAEAAKVREKVSNQMNETAAQTFARRQREKSKV